MHIRRSTALKVGVASVLAVGAFGPIASATTVPPGTDAGGEGGGDCVVGVSWNNFQEPRWAAWDEPTMKGAIEAGGGSYISTDAQSSVEQQASDVENLIAQGANVLVILAQDGTAILPSVASALSNGVPVIAYDRLIDDPGVLYMTFDNVGVGRTIAEVIYEIVPTGNYVIIKGNSADANADFLRAGMEEVIGDAVAAGDITIVGETYTDNWDAALAQTEMEQFLTETDNDVQAVLSENDSMAGGVDRRPRGPGPRRPGARGGPGRRPARPQPGRSRHTNGECLEGLPHSRRGRWSGRLRALCQPRPRLGYGDRSVHVAGGQRVDVDILRSSADHPRQPRRRPRGGGDRPSDAVPGSRARDGPGVRRHSGVGAGGHRGGGHRPGGHRPGGHRHRDHWRLTTLILDEPCVLRH